MSEFNVNSDMFGMYCKIPTGFSRTPHIYKIVSRIDSNTYCDLPLGTCNTKETIHKETVPVLLVIHCGIDETEVKRVALSDCELCSSDKFFIIAQHIGKGGKLADYFVDERTVSGFGCDGKIVYDYDEIDFPVDEVFFDKEKAEAKLKEINNGDMREAFEPCKETHEQREVKALSDIELAESLLRQNAIEYKICNVSTGQINAYIGGKCLTFYANTGKIQGYTNARGIKAFVNICKRKLKELGEK